MSWSDSRRWGLKRSEQGFTLIETMVVLAIVAVLMTLGLVAFARYARLADDAAMQLDLLTAVKVQALHHLQAGEFTTDSAALRSLEPNLQYSVDGAGETVVVTIAAGRAEEAVCVFGHSGSGDWFSIHHSLDTGDRLGQSAPAECTAAAVADWVPADW